MCPKKLHNRIALITGASNGIGRATALRFGREGACVAVNYLRSQGAAEEVVEQIRSSGGAAAAIRADVANDAEVRLMMAFVEQEFGGLDFLVNNTGWSTIVPHTELEALTDEIWDRTFDVNVRGAFYCARAAVPLLTQRSGAAIVNIASAAGLTGFGSSIAYSAAKGALLTMTKSLARSLAPAIRVNAVAPGAVHTNFANWPESAFQQSAAISPLQRIATVDEIAAAVLFLCADASSTTGEVITIDSGLTHLGKVASRTE